MKFLKNNLKVIIAFIVGIILASSIAVYATISASEVDYKNGKKVSEALDDLYSKVPSKEDVKITEATTGINVRDALTIDTSSLYPKSQDGENVFFKKCSVELDANGYGVIDDIGFTPKTIVVVWDKTNEKAYSYKNINNIGNAFCTNGNIESESDNTTIVFGTNSVTFNGTSYWAGATVYAVIFKATL